MALADLIDRGDLTAAENQLIEYFVKDTTKKIFRRMDLMDIHSTKLRSSIHGVIYNNAGGNDTLVRFYWLNFGRFLELGLGRYGSDYDLGGEGIKVRNVDIPEITSGNYGPLDPEFKDETDRGLPVRAMGLDKHHRPVRRDKFHKAKPFFTNTIRQEVKRISERLAIQQGYTHTIYMLRGIISTLAMDDADRQWRESKEYREQFRMSLGALDMED